MKENPRIRYGSSSSSPRATQHRLNDHLESESNTESWTPRYPLLSDDIIDEMLAELHEEENAAHE